MTALSPLEFFEAEQTLAAYETNPTREGAS